MDAEKVGGRVGPFLDPATGGTVEGRVVGSFTYQSQGDAVAVLGHVRVGLLRAINGVLQQKLNAGQVALPTIQQSLPYFTAEIIAASGAADMGVQITALDLTVSLENPNAGQPQAAALPPTPMQATADAFAQAAQDELDPRNYEYEARVDVGGFRINASTDGGLDTAGLAEQAKDKAKSTLIWWAGGCVIIGIILIGLAGVGWWVWAQYRAASSGTAGSRSGTKSTAGKAEVVRWDGKKGFICSGSKHLRIEGTTAKLSSGTAIQASANCRLELSKVNITAPIAIQALANAAVTVEGGSITGKPTAAKALGKAKITFKGSKVTGKKQALGAATIHGP